MLKLEKCMECGILYFSVIFNHVKGRINKTKHCSLTEQVIKPVLSKRVPCRINKACSIEAFSEQDY